MAPAENNDQQQVDEIMQRIAGDLSMIVDRPLKISTAPAQRSQTRVAGTKLVHISFKLGFQHGGRITHGCILIPLPDAIALACYLMMVPDDGVKSKRNLTTLDAGTKDSMLEVANFIGGATDAALRSIGMQDIRVRSEGCQGVRPNVRPAFSYEEGSTLIVERAKAQLHTWPPFEMLLLLPVLEAAGVSPAAS